MFKSFWIRTKWKNKLKQSFDLTGKVSVMTNVPVGLQCGAELNAYTLKCLPLFKREQLLSVTSLSTLEIVFRKMSNNDCSFVWTDAVNKLFVKKTCKKKTTETN